jgi:sugar/nucleoside kinase (ribokinase family)
MRFHVFGDAFVDIVAQNVSDLPKWGTGTEASEISNLPGGSALNTSVHLKNLLKEERGEDEHEVVLFTALGGTVDSRNPDEVEGDWAAKVLQNHLEEIGVILRPKWLKNKPTGTCIVLSGNKDRAFITSAGAVGLFHPDHVNIEELASCDHLHLGGLYALESFSAHLPKMVERVREINPSITISADTNFDSAGRWGTPWLAELLRLINVIKLNEEEAEEVRNKNFSHPDELQQPAICWLASRVRTAAVITQGEAGALVALSRDPTNVIAIESPQVEVVDACGAGDAWNAGFIATWVKNRANLVEAVQFGCGSGALSVTNVGACKTPVDKLKAEALLRDAGFERPAKRHFTMSEERQFTHSNST